MSTAAELPSKPALPAPDRECVGRLSTTLYHSPELIEVYGDARAEHASAPLLRRIEELERQRTLLVDALVSARSGLAQPYLGNPVEVGPVLTSIEAGLRDAGVEIGAIADVTDSSDPVRAALVEALRADAERWRHFLRRRFVMGGGMVMMDAHRTAPADELLYWIDAAIAARKGEGSEA